MSFLNRRTLSYLGLVIATTVVLTLAYSYGMAVWEGRPRPLYQSLEVVVQSFTTTGYGEDAPWQSPQMNALVILMQFTGIGLILTAVDVFAVPWLRSALSSAAPTSTPERDGHVVICSHTPRTDALVTELDARDHSYVLVEPDEERAQNLHEDNYEVIHGDPESTAVLEAAHVEKARAVVADSSDDTNASIVLSVRAVAPDVQMVTLVEDAELAQYHSAAGADDVLSPRQLLGRSLAAELPTAVTASVDESVVIGEAFELVEFAIEPGSELANRTFAAADLRERFGVNVLGAWVDGDFETPADPDTELEPGTRLLAAGDPDRLTALREATASTVRQLSPQRVILAGYGDSGQAAHDALTDTSSEVTVLDSVEKGGVDVVGDARDPEVLQAAGIDDASALLLMVGDDTAATLSTLIARRQNPDVRVIVRANEEENTQKLRRAGADYVQSLATISGRMLASTVFEDEDVLSYSKQINVVRLSAGSLAGSTISEAAIRSETGCTVVAIVRDGETITEFDPDSFEFQAGDEAVVAGTDESTTAFETAFGS
ncbi:potassium channel family protein [Salinibaculum rarum]|uniref:potassium channel family protein n=1 Tax=Salinibaculum rarum TaxID=3058903 RepID=UPI00265F6D09|nr:NAD-binding protein [Salinibaculum sp. KK48]